MVDLIRIHYGPYEAHGVVTHRTERLRGIQEQMRMRGVPVTFVPSFHWDRLEIEIAGQKIFQCRETALDYNSDGNDDQLCSRIIKEIMNAIRRIIPSLYDYYDTFELHQLALREEYLKELSLYHRWLIESLLEDVVLSANRFCENIVMQIIEDAVNFKVNLCRQIAEDALTAAVRQVEAAEALRICQPIAETISDQVVDISEEETKDYFHHLVEQTVSNAYYSTDEGKMALCQEVIEDAIDEAFYSTSDGKTEFAQSMVECVIDEAYVLTADGKTEICHQIMEDIVEDALDDTKEERTRFCKEIVSATVQKSIAKK